jgi:hypothetical protein
MRFSFLKKLLGPSLTVKARCIARGLPIPFWGNLKRTRPFSSYFGFERGTPVDREYLWRFLAANSEFITGKVLEVQLSTTSWQFGKKIERVDTVDILPDCKPTFLCDLAEADIIPSDTYDCFLLPSVLPSIERIEPAMKHILRVVKPGGHVLASMVGLVPSSESDHEYWRLTPKGWKALAERNWPNVVVEIESFGNCLTAAAAMYGLTKEEVGSRAYTVNDDRFAVVITLKARKPF